MSDSVVSLLVEADKARDNKQWGSAAERYKRYLELRPKDAGIWVQYGHTLKEIGNLAGADKAYVEALKRRPWEADTYLQVGHLRKLQQRPEAALFWYRLALGLAARHADARREIETLEAQGIVAQPERLPVPWVSALIAVLKRVRGSRAAPLIGAGPVSLQASADNRAVDPFENAWRQYLPSFIEATSNIAALGHEYARLRRDFETRLTAQEATLRAEIATLRRQIGGTEQRAEAKASTTPTGTNAATTQVLDEAQPRYAASSGDLRLLIGAGLARAGYLCVSDEAREGVDVIASPDNLPFETGSVSEMVVSGVFEGFDDSELQARLFPHWLTVLKPGGRLVVTVPDAIAIASGVVRGVISIDDYRALVLGSHEMRAKGRRNLFSRESLTELLRRSGFCNIDASAQTQVSGSAFEFIIHAYAPEAHHG